MEGIFFFFIHCRVKQTMNISLKINEKCKSKGVFFTLDQTPLLTISLFIVTQIEKINWAEFKVSNIAAKECGH